MRYHGMNPIPYPACRPMAPVRYAEVPAEEENTWKQRMTKKANETTPDNVHVSGWAKLLAWAIGQYGSQPAVLIVLMCFFVMVAGLVAAGYGVREIYKDQKVLTQISIENVGKQADSSAKIAAALDKQAESINRNTEMLSRLTDEIKLAHIRALQGKEE